MSRALQFLLLGLMHGFCSPVLATVDCPKVQSRSGSMSKPAVIAYSDASSIAISPAAASSIEEEMNNEVLSDYLGSPSLRPEGISGLVFVICGQPKGASTLEEADDSGYLQASNVTVAMWRANQGGRPGVFYAVVPQARDNDTVPRLGDPVVGAEAVVAAAPPLKFWVKGIQRDDALMMALVGFGYGNRLLDAKEYLHAKLALCKSKRDLQRSLSSLLRPTSPASQLIAQINQSLLAAEKRLADAKETWGPKLRADKRLQASIQASCDP